MRLFPSIPVRCFGGSQGWWPDGHGRVLLLTSQMNWDVQTIKESRQTHSKHNPATLSFPTLPTFSFPSHPSLSATPPHPRGLEALCVRPAWIHRLPAHMQVRSVGRDRDQALASRPCLKSWLCPRSDATLGASLSALCRSFSTVYLPSSGAEVGHSAHNLEVPARK